MSKVPAQAQEALLGTAHVFAQRGWLRATSGNLSVLDEDTGLLCITRSGVDKQHLLPDDIIGLSADGTVVAGQGTPSFETAIHQTIYRLTQARAIFHVHTVYNNLAARYSTGTGIILTGHEMLKALGHWGEGARITIPVVPNYADIGRAALAVEQVLNPAVPGVLLARHGIYAFGDSVARAARHLEAFEFLFEWLYLDRLAESAWAAQLPLSREI